ncbi:hypothetical protein ACO11K_000395 [Bacillus cytotoxicus]|uniref:hypothetical protein n=1 Tax=Bacillus cereus group sp. BfR-BA-01492 TaxID=2920361 RepID=UPI001F57A502|nr:hypothetical protein [Bacillus cereus group sp. BfR-BA-01492]
MGRTKSFITKICPICKSKYEVNQKNKQVHQKHDEWLNKEFGEKKIWSELYSDIERVAEMTIPHTF